MKVPIEVSPEEMRDLLNAVYEHHKAAPHPTWTDIPDLVRAAFLTGLGKWMNP